MAKSKILKELVNEEISLNIALKRLIVLAADINDNDLKEWAEKEINGYNADDEVPNIEKYVAIRFTIMDLYPIFKSLMCHLT